MKSQKINIGQLHDFNGYHLIVTVNTITDKNNYYILIIHRPYQICDFINYDDIYNFRRAVNW